jgi:hypothetical protein
VITFLRQRLNYPSRRETEAVGELVPAQEAEEEEEEEEVPKRESLCYKTVIHAEEVPKIDPSDVVTISPKQEYDEEVVCIAESSYLEKTSSLNQ